PVELWHAGQRLDSRTVRLGLRTFQAGPKGVRCNGRLLELRGRSVEGLDDESALALRAEGINLLVADAALSQVWEIADRVGFAVLGRIGGESPAERAAHPSHLGWLVPDDRALPAEGIVAVSPAHPAAGEAALIVGDAPVAHAPGSGRIVVLS
ncbi:MAG: hypothetical protein K2W96_20330, partial [Gemmataceae bacterium]|nr:hypothetical protein [Gemmataceae bacterium]